MHLLRNGISSSLLGNIMSSLGHYGIGLCYVLSICCSHGLAGGFMLRYVGIRLYLFQLQNSVFYICIQHQLRLSLIIWLILCKKGLIK